MATVYKFDVRCVSAFIALPEYEVAAIIEKALRDHVDEKSGLRFESISVTPKARPTLLQNIPKCRQIIEPW